MVYILTIIIRLNDFWTITLAEKQRNSFIDLFIQVWIHSPLPRESPDSVKTMTPKGISWYFMIWLKSTENFCHLHDQIWSRPNSHPFLLFIVARYQLTEIPAFKHLIPLQSSIPAICAFKDISLILHLPILNTKPSDNDPLNWKSEWDGCLCLGGSESQESNWRELPSPQWPSIKSYLWKRWRRDCNSR